MDDQEILKLKKISGKKRRSRNCVSSSCTLVKENFELNQLLDGGNTMVYALVEILKDSEESAKREKIPLNDKDLFLMMQKFISSKKEKLDRKILRPSLKRKHGSEFGESNSKILKDQENLAACELGNQSYELSDTLKSLNPNTTLEESSLAKDESLFLDKTNHSCKSSNYSIYGKIYNKDKYRKRHAAQNGYKISDQENEPSDLKILYNRNANERHETKVKRERTNSMSRGTNTDIVQTPKVLGEVLQALNLNMENSSENKQKTHSREGLCGKEGQNFIQTSVHNFLLVPFIVANKHDEKWKKTKNNSCESLAKDELRCFKCSQSVEYNKHRREMIRTGRSHRSFTDLREDTKPLQESASNGIKTNYTAKNRSTNEGEKSGTSAEAEEGRERDSIKGECFLEEVKMLQTKLNEIIKGLEMNNLIYCNHNCGVFRKEESGNESNHTKSEEGENSLSERNYSDPEKYGIAGIILPRETSAREDAPSFQDFCVQVTLTKSSYEKAVAATSEITFGKKLKLDKLSQFPSDVKMEPPAKRPRRRILAQSKSTPLFRTSIEYKIVKTKRASSLLFNGKITENVDYLNLRKLNLKFEGSRPDNGDMFEEELRLPEENKLKSEHPNSDLETEKAANVLFETKSSFREPEGRKEVFHTVKPVGKIAKIKIIGSTTLSDKSPDSGIEKIKLELDETNTIKISNKLTRKINTNISNGNSNTTNSSNSNISSNPRNNSNVNNNIREVENNRKSTGNGKVSGNCKFMKKETVPRKAEATKLAKPGEKSAKSVLNALDYDTSQTGVKDSKSKKQTTPARITSKGKENGTPKCPQRTEPPSEKTEVQQIKPPDEIRSMEKAPPSSDKKFQSVDSCKTDTKSQPPTNEIKSAPSDESAKTVIHKPSTPHYIEEVTVSEKVDQNSDKQSQAVKSIWALTKVILYKDGSQSFQVLEASSSPPPGYHLNQSKRKETGEDNESNADCYANKCAVINTENVDKNENSDLNNCSNSMRKTN